jgi:phosphoribosyl-AMP cyclohydrolase
MLRRKTKTQGIPKLIDLEKIDFNKDMQGLLPVVVQDEQTKDVLMLAYCNKQAVEETIKTGYAHYWSRSRKKLWKKGETSGNVQKVKIIMVDCDNDAILYVVNQKGVACHKGNWSCFGPLR